MDSEKENAYFLILRKRKKEKKKRLWKKKYNYNHDIFGCYGTLFKELKEHDEHSFANFSRMYPHIFDELLIKITPLIEKKDTFFRNSISCGERLAVTLRFLATGKL